MPREKRTAAEIKASILQKQKNRKNMELGKVSKDVIKKTVIVPKGILKTKPQAKTQTKQPQTALQLKSIPTKTTCGVGGMKKVNGTPKRHAKTEKDVQLSITKPVMIRFARTAGCKRLQHMWGTIRGFMMDEVRKILRGSFVLTDYKRKKTVAESDVREFAARSGNSLYS